ncbi:MAG: DUF4416 family protein [Phycisphaerae bacterium]|nr:DUF4416 family protein [Phycisphaerae bacterium]
MWSTKEPRPARLIVGMLAPDERCLKAAAESLAAALGPADLASEVWPFDQTRYYADEIGPAILRQFISMETLVDPGRLASVKHLTNRIEQDLAASLGLPVPRPVNLDPGLIEASKLVLATTKNYSHRIYIGDRMYAEVTLVYDRGCWCPMPHTYPDYRLACYHAFFSKVRARLVEQLRGLEQS